jgi:hypothetical protein
MKRHFVPMKKLGDAERGSVPPEHAHGSRPGAARRGDRIDAVLSSLSLVRDLSRNTN